MKKYTYIYLSSRFLLFHFELILRWKIQLPNKIASCQLVGISVKIFWPTWSGFRLLADKFNQIGRMTIILDNISIC